MYENFRKKLSDLVVLGFVRNSFYKYFYSKIFLRNRNILALVIAILLLNLSIWGLWFNRIVNSGFAIESYFNFALNLPWIPRYLSLLFMDSFISLVNLILAFIIYKKNSFAAQLLIFADLFINIFILFLTIFYIVSFKL